MIYAGIDYSMTSPAVCVYAGDPKKFSFKKCLNFSLSDHKIKNPTTNLYTFNTHNPFNSQMERFDHLAQWVMGIIGSYQDILVGIEDYAMGAKGKVFHIGECGGILKHTLWKAGIEFQTYPPTVIKKHATGKGNAKKTDMYAQFMNDTKIDLKQLLQPNRLLGSPTTDIIDSYYICSYAIKNNS